MKYHYLIVTAILLFSVFSCKKEQGPSGRSEAEAMEERVLYSGGTILSMNGEQPQYLEALVEERGKIVFTGTLKEARKKYGEDVLEKDLEGATLLPGFIDGHCHFAAFGAQAVTANLLAPPDGGVETIAQLVDALKEWYGENGTEKTKGWIIGMGYDDAILEERRHPTRQDLDKVSAEVPVMVVHISGHFAALNTKALEEVGYTTETPDPEGGIIRREADGKQPNGVLEELAAIPVMFKMITPEGEEMNTYYLDKAQELALKYGYTTAQEGRAMSNHEQLVAYAEKKKLKLDVVSYIDYMFPQYMATSWNSREYKDHYRIGGLKLTLDGSPQGRTAWRTEPYLLPPDGQKEGYKGYPAIPDQKKVDAIVNNAYANDWQVLAHTNGDAAADQLIAAVAGASGKYGNRDRRTVLIHGQLLRMDQLDSLKKYDMMASLFPMHTFYWGDWYKEIIGPEKAEKISPTRSALNKGIHITSHTDAPVALPNLMMILHTTVNRVTRSGDVLGPEERLSPYEALKALTIWSAWQHFEENSKGTLEVGKMADMVILDHNPLTVDPMTLKDIRVIETIKAGETVYKLEGR